MVVYRCEDTLESVFTAIYNSYEDKRDVADTCISLDDERYLFAEDVPVTPDSEKTAKVMRTLRRQFGEKDFCGLCFALSAPDTGKAQAVYRTVAAGLAGKYPPGHLFDNLADADVHKAFSLMRNAQREYQHLQGFVRFAELENGILYAKTGPKNNLLTFLTPHFADRFPGENFVIYDELRSLYGVHPAGAGWYLVQGREVFGAEACGADSVDSLVGADSVGSVDSTGSAGSSNGIPASAEEAGYQELFRLFCKTIAIEERLNPVLQRNLLPLRFREYMTEFQ